MPETLAAIVGREKGKEGKAMECPKCGLENLESALKCEIATFTLFVRNDSVTIS